MQLAAHAHETLAPARVQHGRGLVQDEDGGLHGQHAGDGHALLLPARQRRGLALVEALQPHVGQRVGHALAQLVGGHAQVLGAEGHVVFDEACHQLVVGVLEHHAGVAADEVGGALVARVAVEHGDAALVRHEQRVDVLGQRRLARPVAAQDAHELAPLDACVHAVQHEALAVVREACSLELDHAASVPSPASSWA